MSSVKLGQRQKHLAIHDRRPDKPATLEAFGEQSQRSPFGRAPSDSRPLARHRNNWPENGSTSQHLRYTRRLAIKPGSPTDRLTGSYHLPMVGRQAASQCLLRNQPEAPQRSLLVAGSTRRRVPLVAASAIIPGRSRACACATAVPEASLRAASHTRFHIVIYELHRYRRKLGAGPTCAGQGMFQLARNVLPCRFIEAEPVQVTSSDPASCRAATFPHNCPVERLVRVWPRDAVQHRRPTCAATSGFLDNDELMVCREAEPRAANSRIWPGHDRNRRLEAMRWSTFSLPIRRNG